MKKRAARCKRNERLWRFVGFFLDILVAGVEHGATIRLGRWPMQIESRERRRVRSENPLEALLLQLSHVRDEAGLSAVVLASQEGLTIAHAGDEDVCCE